MKAVGFVFVALALAACTIYAPKPIRPAEFPAAIDARRLDEKPPGAAWTRAELLASALARNPHVVEAEAKYQTALAAANTAKASPGPTFTLTAEYASERPRWGYGAAAEVPLDRGTRRSARIGIAELQALQAWYDYAEATWTVRTALARALVDLSYSNAEIPLLQRAVDLRRQRLERLESRVRAGEDPRNIALVAQAELAAVEQRLTQSRGKVEAADASLAQALGVSPAAVRGLVLGVPGPSPAFDELSDWRRDAALSRRDVLKAIADYDIAENNLRLEVAKQYPEVRLGPGYMYDHGVDKLPFNLALVLPSRDLNRRAIDQAEAARAAAGRTLETTQAEVLAAIDKSDAALRAAKANRDRIETGALPAARASAAATSRAVAAGEADRVDDLAARSAELDVEVSLLDAEWSVATAATDLEDALRRSVDPAEGAVLQSALAAQPRPQAAAKTGVSP